MVECLECNNQCWVEFQLVDNEGNGKAYAGLEYLLTDSGGTVHKGVLSASGSAKHDDLPCGGVILSFAEKYKGDDTFYRALVLRAEYPLPITQLQYAAEQTQWFKKDEFKPVYGWHTELNDNTLYHQDIEVRHLVEHVGHLPVFGTKRYSKIEFPRMEFNIAYSVRGSIPYDKRKDIPSYGIGLETNRKHVLEIKPLRAYRPVLSLSNEFSSLNLYQLSILGALSYREFEEEIISGDYFKNPVANGYFYPKKTGSGMINSVFISELSNHYESGIYGKAIGDQQRFGLLMEDVPYSKRFETFPFDPELYPANKLYQEALDNRQEPPDEAETPKKIHYFDDSDKSYIKGEGMNTQGFITHSDEVLLISIRGTQETEDFLTDGTAGQVQMDDYPKGNRAHAGFYKSFRVIKEFIAKYLRRFYSGQKVIVVGHSLGGAIATLVADWIKVVRKIDDTILYTYGSPRVGNTEFVKQSSLMHYRMVAENDPIPSVPGEFLSNANQAIIFGGAIGYASGKDKEDSTGYAILGAIIALFVVNKLDDDAFSTYEHHGTLRHFTVPPLHDPSLLSDVIMWEPGCKGAVACSPELSAPAHLPKRADIVTQMTHMSDHFMFNSYIPFSYSTFLRWKKSVDNSQFVVTKEESEVLEKVWREYQRQLEIEEEKPNHSRRIINQLKSEISRVALDRARAKELASEKISIQQLYGADVSQSNEIESIYEQWQTKDNEFIQRRPQEVAVIKKI